MLVHSRRSLAFSRHIRAPYGSSSISRSGLSVSPKSNLFTSLSGNTLFPGRGSLQVVYTSRFPSILSDFVCPALGGALFARFPQTWHGFCMCDGLRRLAIRSRTTLFLQQARKGFAAFEHSGRRGEVVAQIHGLESHAVWELQCIGGSRSAEAWSLRRVVGRGGDPDAQFIVVFVVIVVVVVVGDV